MALPRLLWMWLLLAGTRGANDDGDMRLADGHAAYWGRVEIFYQGQWGTVCDNRWDLLDASVVCRALGFGNATVALGRAFFGPGTGPVMLDQVQCMGTEPSLANCSSLGWLTSTCGHEQDASVICSIDARRAGQQGSAPEGRKERACFLQGDLPTIFSFVVAWVRILAAY